LTPRDTIGVELSAYMRNLIEATPEGALRRDLDWYQRVSPSEKIFNLKGVFPLFVKREAEMRKFQVFCYPPITYIGTGSARIIHFAFKLDYTGAVLHAFSKQTVDDVVKLVMCQADNGTLKSYRLQHPSCTTHECQSQLNFLGAEDR